MLKQITKEKYENLKKSNLKISKESFVSASYFVSYGNEKNLEEFFNSVVKSLSELHEPISELNGKYMDYMKKVMKNANFLHFFDKKQKNIESLDFESERNPDKIINHAISFPWVVAYKELKNILEISNQIYKLL